MAVGEYDRRWTSTLSKSCLGCGAYRGCRSRNTGIDQYPSPVSRVRPSKEDDVDDCDLAVSHINGYLTGFIVAPLVGFGMLGAGALGNRNLLHCASRLWDAPPGTAARLVAPPHSQNRVVPKSGSGTAPGQE